MTHFIEEQQSYDHFAKRNISHFGLCHTSENNLPDISKEGDKIYRQK
jgi:hypothetical protein